jgi:hypothetical protein
MLTGELSRGSKIFVEKFHKNWRIDFHVLLFRGGHVRV